MEHFTLKGGGGTDFRPAFAYVEERMAAEKLGAAPGASVFYGRVRDFPGENAAL